ncbi:C2 family cysteine protease [Nocardiopsis mangrovi]|uniref:C2 family cysteine protease n=1 Tax=Nocardiopsis mangrovi TaxID=1179818 RepID=A0ABV9DPW4_9ACTN
MMPSLLLQRIRSGPPPPSAQRSRRRPRFGDRGAGFAEYGAVILLVAGIAAVVFATGIGDRVAGFITTALCEVSSAASDQEDCAADTVADGDGPPDARPMVDPDEWFGPVPEPPPGFPSGQDFDDAQDDIDRIREYLGDDSLFCWWWCPDEPQDVMADMTDGELNALMWSLTDDEIRELLREDGVREIVLSRVDINTLRHLRGIDPDGIEPDFDDVGGDDANEEDGEPRDDLAFGTVPDGRLWPENGEPSSSDLSQGGLGDCWWLASMGAIADQNPQIIRDMIRENGNGTYTVTFGDGEQVTVTPDIVLNEDGSAAFSSPNNNTLWPAILEKAYAEREGSFGEIEGGWPKDGMETITGNDSEDRPASDVDERQLTEWLSNGTAVTITTTGDKEGDLYDNDVLVRNHAYVVTGVRDGVVQLYNPWGRNHASMTMEQFRQQLDTVETNSLE